MVRTTRAQRVKLADLLNRLPEGERPAYRAFRGSVQATFGCDNAVTVKWAGMWICIETDGYAHS